MALLKELHVEFDSKRELEVAEGVFWDDFFLEEFRDEFSDNAHYLISEAYYISWVPREEGEKWIVSLIRETRRMSADAAEIDLDKAKRDRDASFTTPSWLSVGGQGRSGRVIGGYSLADRLHAHASVHASEVHTRLLCPAVMIKTEPTDSVLGSEVPRSPQPRVGRRRGRIEILLPTRRRLYRGDPPPYEDASSFISKYLEAIVKEEEEKSGIILPLTCYGKVEIKKEEMLSEDVVAHRIGLVPSLDVDVDPTIRDVTTTRAFTSRRWGGNTQSTFPAIRPDMVARHGLEDFMYLNLFFNPHAPQRPGEPGLFFASSAHPVPRAWPTVERVLVRLQSNRWLYVGQYECTPAASLAPEEWTAQAPKVKQTWTTKVSTQGWGYDIRAKIVLRKRLGRDPTAQEFKNALNSEEKFHATPEEIHRAFDEGRAFIQSWSMKCVGYDEDFQREIAAGNAAN